ncbi:hypothetical protein RU86_GL001790 [Lactococcus piscium]|uniref:Uncharacterized protein n=1 Tax=Pseudolactococcus piscium TaxID=1364 RepID=A0A2A5RUI2_9LACT|nr:hypothetical protein [Lactococcus piscium]PCS03960.1 hypothetical protein RU86_GL001790 [Lactococcus piscium]
MYNKLLKKVNTTGGFGIGILSVSAMTLPFSSLLYILLKIVSATFFESKYFILFLISLLFAFITHLSVNLFFKKKNIIHLKLLKSERKLLIKKLDKISKQKIWINNVLQFIIFIFMPFGIAVVEHQFISLLIVYFGGLLFLNQHRMFFVRASEINVDFIIK